MMRLAEVVTAALVATPFAIGTAVAGPDRAGVEFRFRDPQIVESSGLVARDDLFVTVNDSGDSGRTFVVDGATGRTVGGAAWVGEPVDVEALAPTDHGSVLVGDIGDNAGSRDSVTLLEVPSDRGFEDVEPTAYQLTYSDGPRDAETLLVHPVSGRVLVVSKSVLGGVLYAAPNRLSETGPNVLEPVGDVLGFATDGAFFPDGRHFVLRDYGRAVVYSYPELAVVGELRLPGQQQGEGIAVDQDARVFVSTEGQFSAVHRVGVPRRIAEAVAPTPTESVAPPDEPQEDSAEPAADEVVVERPAWMWWLGGLVGIGMIMILIRSLRPR
ncbi:MAG: WD40 repeat domain-containing protein [Actinomycetota bacterium]|nr:WD40 repeat domain-containing protein [Actinomycetota bacterium]